MNFADILLPLPLDGLFTYAVPPALSDAVAPGKRVVVQFGAKKEYSGIVVRLHDNHPGEGINVKPVIDVIDPEPVVTREQLAFWKWMAGYYLCHEGDVMKAALPAGPGPRRPAAAPAYTRAPQPPNGLPERPIECPARW